MKKTIYNPKIRPYKFMVAQLERISFYKSIIVNLILILLCFIFSIAKSHALVFPGGNASATTLLVFLNNGTVQKHNFVGTSGVYAGFNMSTLPGEIVGISDFGGSGYHLFFRTAVGNQLGYIKSDGSTGLFNFGGLTATDNIVGVSDYGGNFYHAFYADSTTDQLSYWRNDGAFGTTSFAGMDARSGGDSNILGVSDFSGGFYHAFYENPTANQVELTRNDGTVVLMNYTGTHAGLNFDQWSSVYGGPIGISDFGGTNYHAFMFVPEPSSALLVLSGLSFLLMRRKRNLV